ncbi:hypothetical protein HK099_006448, partial [Clydaea vesicula]
RSVGSKLLRNKAKELDFYYKTSSIPTAVSTSLKSLTNNLDFKKKNNESKITKTNLSEFNSTEQNSTTAAQESFNVKIDAEEIRPNLKSTAIPSSRIGRIISYGNIASSVGVGIFAEATKRIIGLSDKKGSTLMTESNVTRIVDGLTRMRGAALKLGQMLSIQDESILTPELEAILLKVQNKANYMPDSQLEKVMRKELGEDWEEKHFSSFDRVPIAAASLGQVHIATTKADNVKVAVKVQYPGVASSIDSDLDNLRSLLVFSNLLPKGLYLDSTIKAARVELSLECDYERELKYMDKFHDLVKYNKNLNNFFYVPKTFKSISTKRVLVSEFKKGISIGNINLIKNLSQKDKNLIGDKFLKLSLSELFEFKLMQTDPNFSNFLFDGKLIYLIDFGATRNYSTKFILNYFRLLNFARKKDVDGCFNLSKELGFLTGFESEAMKNAHINSLIALAEPFSSNHQIFDFTHQDITTKVKADIPLMLRERLSPPPVESYSIHRKLSGLFLLCSKLGSQIECSRIFDEYFEKFEKLLEEQLLLEEKSII